MDAGPIPPRELTPGRDRLPPDLLTLRIVAHAGDGRPRQHEMCRVGVDVAGEPLQHAGHVLHPVPAGDLDDERRQRIGRTAFTHDVRSMPYSRVRLSAVFG